MNQLTRILQSLDITRRHKAGLALLGLSALSIRILYLLQAADNPLFDHPIVDARTYVRTALQLSEGQWLGAARPFWQPPLYSYFLGGLFTLFGENYYLPRLVQASSGTAVCLLIYSLGCRLFSPGVGWLAAGIAALYGPFLYFEAELLPAGIAVFLNALALLALLRAADARSGGRWLVAGLLLGAAALTVASVLLFVPFAILWARRQVQPPHLPAMVALVLGLLLAIAPVTLRNRVVGGEWVLISNNAGINFYIGNNPNYDVTTNIRPGRHWQELTELPEREAGISGRAAASRYFFGRSLDYLIAEPLGYFGLQLRKLYLFWRGDEIPRNLDPYFARHQSWLLQALLWIRGLAFPFGLVSPLALMGMLFYLRDPASRSPAGNLLLLFVTTYTLAVVLFFVTSRYRLPVTPPLLLFAGFAVMHLRLLRGRALVRRLVPLGLLTLGLNAGSPAAAGEGNAQEHVYLGQAYVGKGMLANALRQYRLALEMEPTHEIALEDLGTLYARRGESRRAITTWERLLKQYPDHPRARRYLAELSFQTADYTRAARHYGHLAEENPDRAILHARLAQARNHSGDLNGAADAYRRALQRDPEALPLHRQLARLEIDRRKFSAALPHVRFVEQRAGIDPEAHRQVAELFQLMGMAEASAAAFNRAIDLGQLPHTTDPSRPVP